MDTPELFERFLASRRTAHRSPATVAWYVDLLLPLVEDCPGELTTEDIENWLATAPSTATARARLRAVRAMCNWAAKRFQLPSAAAAIIPPRPNNKLPRVFTGAELRRIFAAAKDPRDVAAITVLLDTGVRIGELASLRAEWVDEDGATVHGKTGQRRVPLSPEARRALMRIAMPTGPIFRTTVRRPVYALARPELIEGPRKRGGQPGNTNRLMHGKHSVYHPERAPDPQAMAVGTLNLRIRDVVKAAGVTGDKVGPHTFRHTFATMYLRAGGDLHRLQRLMGHTSIKQTMVYLHLADPKAFEEHARLSPLNQLRRAN